MKLKLLLAALLIAAPIQAQDARPAGVEAKYVIILIGDGMGYNQVALADGWHSGGKGRLEWLKWDTSFALATYPHNGSYSSSEMWQNPDYCRIGPTDSAAAATALSAGKKTDNGRIGVLPNGDFLTHLLETAEEKGKSTGVVSSVQFSHATPAGFVAHNESRNNYAAIAWEMLNSDLDVIMGAGHPFYDNNGVRRDAAIDYKYVGGWTAWQDLNKGTYGKLITEKGDFRKMRKGKTPERVIGIARVLSTLQQRRSSVAAGGAAAESRPFQTPLNNGVPSLADMTDAALNVLDENQNGFVLMVESGAIDWSGHANQTARNIEETLALHDATRRVVRWVKRHATWDDVLIVVTSDHETGYLVAAGSNSSGTAPGIRKKGALTGVDWLSGGHTNQLVPVYARGGAAEKLARKARKTDAVRGAYMDNTRLGRYLKRLVR